MFSLSHRNISLANIGLMISVIDPDNQLEFFYNTVHKLANNTDFIVDQGVITDELVELRQAFEKSYNEDANYMIIANTTILACLTLAIVCKRSIEKDSEYLTLAEVESINEFYYAVRSYICGKCAIAGGSPDEVSMSLLQASTVTPDIFLKNKEATDKFISSLSPEKRAKLMPNIIGVLAGFIN